MFRCVPDAIGIIRNYSFTSFSLSRWRGGDKGDAVGHIMAPVDRSVSRVVTGAIAPTNF